MTHTPGPWTAVQDDPLWEVQGTSPKGHVLLIAAYCGEDDARLIAAAPDLLAACEQANEAITFYERTLKDLLNQADPHLPPVEVVCALGTTPVRDLIRAAITKATGEVQS